MQKCSIFSPPLLTAQKPENPQNCKSLDPITTFQNVQNFKNISKSDYQKSPPSKKRKLNTPTLAQNNSFHFRSLLNLAFSQNEFFPQVPLQIPDFYAGSDENFTAQNQVPSQIPDKNYENLSNDDENLEDECKIAVLFPEVLAHIFSFLPVKDLGRAAQVCKYWHEVSHEKIIWRKIEAKLHLKSSSSSNAILYNSLNRRGISSVQVLSLKRSLRDLVTGVPKLQSLKLSGCYSVTDWTLSTAFTSRVPTLNYLTSLDLSLCKQITDLSLGRISAHAPFLLNLELGGCCQISDRGLLLISWGLKKLRNLSLRSCYLITDTGIGFLAGVLNPNVLNEPKFREFLSKFEGGGAKKRGESLCAICQQDLNGKLGRKKGGHAEKNEHSGNFPQSFLSKLNESSELGTKFLENLSLQDCQKITDKSLSHIGTGFPYLRSINLSFCVHVSDGGLRDLAHVTTLNELNLRSCDNVTDSGLANLRELSLSLRTLDISFCDKIGNHGIEHLAHYLTKLEKLSLSATDISDNGILSLASSLVRLKTLNLGQCSKLTDSSLRVISEKLLNVEYIDLYGCPSISRHGLNLILNMPKMKTLNLGLWHIR